MGPFFMKYFLLLPFIFLAACGARHVKPGNAVQARKDGNLPENRHMIDTAKGFIRSGDLVFRAGNDLVSEYFKKLNLEDQTYSHCGIASVENGQVYVYHILGGEFNPGEHILHQTFEQFISPYENDAFGVFRYPLTDAERAKMMETAKLIHDAGVRFDMQFDLATDEKMYCAEFVYKTMLIGTNGRLKPEFTHVPMRTGITTDNLFMNRNCRELARFVYK